MSLEILVWLLAVPLVALVHELGHAVAAGPAGYRVSSFGVGSGRALFRWQLPGGAVLHLGPGLLVGGACVAIPVDPVPKRQWLYHAGGLIAQGLLALALLHGSLVSGSPLRLAAGFNLLVLAFNLVPWKVGPYVSDGWTLFAGWWSGGRSGQLFNRRPELERLLAHQREVGAALGEAWCALSLAWIDTLTGRPAVVPEVDEVLLSFEPAVEALHAMVSANVDRGAGRPLAALQRVKGQRVKGQRRASAQHHSAGLADLLTLLEARCYLDLGAPRLAREALARVAGVGGAVAQDAAAVRVEAALVAAEQGEPVDELEDQAFRLAEVMDGGFVDPAAAVWALWEASRCLGAEGRGSASVALGRRARRAAQRLLAEATPQDRETLAARMGEVGQRAAPQRAGDLGEA